VDHIVGTGLGEDKDTNNESLLNSYSTSEPCSQRRNGSFPRIALPRHHDFHAISFTFLRIHLNARYLAVPSKRTCGDVALLTHFLATFKINHHFDFSKLRGTGRRGVSIELCKWLTTRRCIGPNERNEAAR